MTAAHVDVDNHLPSVPRKGYNSWRSWVKTYEQYCTANHVAFRIRTSKSVELYNRKHNINLTEARFYRSFVNYRCKHGVHQERRGAGKRTLASTSLVAALGATSY
ncbi:hypothetical protein PF005_g14565 [Phytophthora fragariae]|uniref:ZSWIM3 N-terminal domain-containing protein n=1 Tax=Phytophthora fragariae TaxID=53985 RepID=A0A6A4D6J4_9STRA|nr:hypothetical protein PF009_g15972 [Phytophthora fragariae]KAE9101830.1 hypothetical protein PF007_g14981 [Phytophthora fragariae]KAE9101923.1 hypothetical protein PF010_g14284 [Phytophthora fragariae]KAE9139309.1 hypothetical protein PF006_g13774 [Phytophthora fragariae]KAE9202410.1 hypothetical protein PF005_g14565 [Phytophthora fragariae]